MTNLQCAAIHDRRRVCRRPIGLLLGCALLAAVWATSPTATAQVDPPGDGGGVNIFAGVLASGYRLQNGIRTVQGAAGFIDIAGKRPIGLEAEARWLGFDQTQEAHSTTWLLGPRYRWKSARYQAYVKGLAGWGNFSAPNDSAQQDCLVLAPGGGVDFTLVGRLRLRLMDAEYQYWPQLTLHPRTSYGISAGLRIRVY